MKNVSSEFLQTMEKRRDFTCYAEVTFLDGTALTLTADDFTVDNNSIAESSGDSGIPLGVAVCKTIQIELANRDEKFSHYDFFGAKIVFKTKFELSETTEAIEEGIFTVLDPYTYGETIIITALDNMYKANTYYATELNFPATLKDMLQDICSTYDIPLGTTTFLNDDFVIDARPEGNYIVRNLIGYIAMIAGGNARINRQGELEIASYDFSVMDAILDGGTFEAWTTGDTVDGGTMEPWSEGEEVSGGSYVGLQPYHILKNFSELKVDTDDVIITGIQMEVETEEGTAELLVGEKGYVLQVENPLISGKEQEALELIGAVLIGGQMRRFEGTHIAYPLAEFMDGCIVVDRRGNAYPTILTDVNFVYFDFTTLKNAAESPTAKGINYSSGYTKAIIEAKKLVEKEKSDRELAVEQLESKLTNASGLYVTPEEQEDGSIIYYMHDKPTLEESQIVWKYTSQAFGVSTDGGVNYPYGFSVTGETITKLLYAEGINADYITTGIIKDATGANYWNLETGEFVTGNGTFSGTITASEFYGGWLSDTSKENYIDLEEGIFATTGVRSIVLGDGTSKNLKCMTFLQDGGFWSQTAESNYPIRRIEITPTDIIMGTLDSDGAAYNYFRVSTNVGSNMQYTGGLELGGLLRLPTQEAAWINALTTSNCLVGSTQTDTGAAALMRFNTKNGHRIAFANYNDSLYLVGALADRTENGFDWSTVWDGQTGIVTFSKDLRLPNEGLLQAKNTSGAYYTLLKMSDSNTVNLGNTTYTTRLYGDNIYLRGTTTAVTSDERLKYDFGSMERYEAAYMALPPETFRYKAGKSGRIHFGIRAQKFKEVLDAHGISTDDCGIYCEAPVDKQAYFEEFGVWPDYDKDLALRYEEMIPWNMYMTQKALRMLYKVIEHLGLEELYDETN